VIRRISVLPQLFDEIRIARQPNARNLRMVLGYIEKQVFRIVSEFFAEWGAKTHIFGSLRKNPEAKYRTLKVTLASARLSFTHKLFVQQKKTP
jgi:hypothetical protein